MLYSVILLLERPLATILCFGLLGICVPAFLVGATIYIFRGPLSASKHCEDGIGCVGKNNYAKLMIDLNRARGLGPRRTNRRKRFCHRCCVGPWTRWIHRELRYGTENVRIEGICRFLPLIKHGSRCRAVSRSPSQALLRNA